MPYWAIHYTTRGNPQGHVNRPLIYAKDEQAAHELMEKYLNDIQKRIGSVRLIDIIKVNSGGGAGEP